MHPGCINPVHFIISELPSLATCYAAPVDQCAPRESLFPRGVVGSAHCSPAAWTGWRGAADSANTSCCKGFSLKPCLPIFISQTSEFKTTPECYRLVTRSPGPSVLVLFSNSAGCWGNKNTSGNYIIFLYFQQNIFVYKSTSCYSICNPDVGAFC